MPTTAHRRPFPLSIILVIGTIAAGLAVRLAPLGLPTAVVKHGGSILWGMMVYWIVSTLRPRWTPFRSALIAAAMAGAVETSQLYHAPPLDAFRRTGVGALLLGRVFAVRDLVAYAASIVTAAAIDAAIRRRRRSAPRRRR